MNSKNTKDSDPNRLHISDKINLMRSNKYVPLSNLSISASTLHVKISKSHIKTKFKSSNVE